MPGRLDILLASIDPDKVVEETFGRANNALNSFQKKSAVIKNWDEFKCCMAMLLRHVESYVLKLSKTPDVSLDYWWSRCVRVLIQLYGINGEKAAFEMARTGNEGGLYAVIRAVAMKVAEEYSDAEIEARISDFWEKLSVEEKFSAVAEYINKYSHLLPSELTEGSAARVYANFPKVLKQHPSLIRRLRSSSS